MNVKGRDLLSVDEESDRLGAVDHAMYKNMDLQEVPFRNVKYLPLHQNLWAKSGSGSSPSW